MLMKQTRPKEQQEFFLKRFRKLNFEFYSLYRKCREQNVYYNGELKRMKKFYYGFARDNFFLDRDVYTGHCSKYCPSFLKFRTQTMIDTADGIYQKLRKIDKSIIKSGKRPKNEDPSYLERQQKKLLERAKHSDIGHCSCCHRDIEIENGTIYDHGHTIGYGYRSGVCFGAGYEAWEVSPKGKIAYVAMLKDKLDSLKRNKPTDQTVSNLNSLKYTQKDIDNEKIVKKYCYAKIGDFLPREYLNKYLRPVDVTLDQLIKIWTDEIDYQQAYIDRQELMIKNWKRELTPREKLKQQK